MSDKQRNKQRYYELVRQRSDVNNEYNAVSDKIEEYEYELKRLKRAKADIKEQKERFKNIKRQHKEIADQSHKWKGSKHNSFKTRMSNIADENNLYYEKSLDRILDSINDEITRLENKKLKQKGLLGKLGALMNSLGNEIENYFN